MMTFFLTILLHFNCALAQEQSSAKQAELLRESGIRAYNEGNRGKSEELLDQSLGLDPSSQTTKQYLDKIKSEKESVSGSRENSKKIGGKNVDEEVTNSVKKGNLKTIPTAKKEAVNPDERKSKRKLDYASTVRPQQFQIPDMYSRLGFPAINAAQLDSARFKTKDQLFIEGDSWPEDSIQRGEGSFFLSYDSNVADFTTDRASSVGLTEKNGAAQNAVIHLGTQSTPLARWNYGLDARSLFKHFARPDLNTFDTLSGAPALWASWWNTRSLEVAARYDYAFTARDLTKFSYFNQTHGPQLGVSVLFLEDYQGEFRYSFKRNDYSETINTDAAQYSGSEHAVILKVIRASAKSSFKPFFTYTFDRNKTETAAFINNAHALDLGATYAYTRDGALRLSTTYQNAFFTSSSVRRIDQLLRFHFTAIVPMTPSFKLFLDTSHTKYTSERDEAYKYYRLAALLGVSYFFTK